MGFPGGLDSKESACSAGDLGLIPWVGKILWRREWLDTLVILAWRILWTEEPGELQAMVGSQSWTRLSDQHFHFYFTVLYNLMPKLFCFKILFSLASKAHFYNNLISPVSFPLKKVRAEYYVCTN